MSKSIVPLAAAALLALAAPATAQDLNRWGTFDNWLVVDDGDGCTMVYPANYERAKITTQVRLEPYEEPEISLSELVDKSVPDPDAIDWGALVDIDLHYAFSAEETPSKVEAQMGREYVSSKQVRHVVYFDADQQFLDRLASTDRLFVGLDTVQRSGQFAFSKPVRALATMRQCVRKLSR